MSVGRRPSRLSAALDLPLAFGFDRFGFLRHRRQFLPEQEVAAAGRLVLITGATSGLGKHTAEELAARGSDVIVWGRSRPKTEGVTASLGGDGQHHTAIADLAEPEQVVAATHTLPARPIDVLILNAGALPHARTITSWDQEVVWASQVLGHMLLLRRLLATDRLAPDARVLWVSSGGMYLQRLGLSDLRWERRDYDGVTAYANAKRAQVVLNEQLHDRLAARGLRLAAMHPGWADTAGVQRSLPTFRSLTRAILRDAAEGADTILWLATTAIPWEGGRFWFDRAPVPTEPVPRTATPPAKRDALWAHVLDQTAPYLHDVGDDGLS